jgi:hypothetical protein
MRRRAALVAVPAAILLAAGPAHALTNPQIPGLQVALREKGVYRGSIDGVAGPMTAHAVRAFQRKAGITVDGIAGPQTRRALGRLGRPLWGKRKLLAPGMVGWDVSVLEFFLARRGLKPGAVDGRFNHRTAGAVRRLQRRKHLAVDGVAGPQTLRALGVRRRSSRTAHAAPPSMLAVQNSLRRWSRYYGVSLQLVRALAWMESGFQPNARSSAGAWGVMQVTPGTWRYVENFIIAHPRRRRARRRRVLPSAPARVQLPATSRARRLLSRPLGGEKVRPLWRDAPLRRERASAAVALQQHLERNPEVRLAHRAGLKSGTESKNQTPD